MEPASLSFLAWPAAAVVCFVAFIAVFWGPIAGLINRSSNVSVNGVGSISADPEKQIEAQDSIPKSISASSLANGAPNKPPSNLVLDGPESEIRRQLESAFPDDTAAQLNWAIRRAAQAAVQREYEVIYRLIVGSQIEALKETNLRHALPIRDAKAIYQRAAERFPEAYSGFSFERWGGFLSARGLIEIPNAAGTDDDRAVLTPRGKDFLHFLVADDLPLRFSSTRS